MKSYQQGVLRSFTSTKLNSNKGRIGKSVRRTKGNLIDPSIKTGNAGEKDFNSQQRLPNGLTSVDEGLVKLETLSNKNLTARFDWLEIEQRLIQLGAKKRLEPIAKNYNRRSGSIEISDQFRSFRRLEERFNLHEL